MFRGGRLKIPRANRLSKPVPQTMVKFVIKIYTRKHYTYIVKFVLHSDVIYTTTKEKRSIRRPVELTLWT